MPAGKIQDEQEVIRWFAEGKTYAEMSALYRTKYNIDTVPSLWGNFRRRRGLARRINRDDELISWAIKKEHRWAYPLHMLRTEARARAGLPIREEDQPRHQGWLSMLAEQDRVVHYDPDTAEGFFYVKRQPTDDDIIRRPTSAKLMTNRRNAD